MALKTALIIPDTHAPYHDKKAYNLMIKVAKDIKPHEIVILGDFADFYSVSSYGKDPRLPAMLIEEVDTVNKMLDQLDDLFPRARKVYLEGNHEHRLEKYLCDKAPAIFGFVDCKELFKINKRPGWAWIKYEPAQRHKVLGSKLLARHTPLGSTAKLSATRALSSLVYGHIHTMEEAHIVGLNGESYVAFSVGWLGNTKYSSIFNYVQNHHQWPLGFGIIHVDTVTKKFYRNKIHILDNYTCVVGGKIYR